MMYHKRSFVPINKEKYKGNWTNIISRSSWETKFMLWCDKNPHVLFWESEETVIPYISPVDNRQHRYFVDFKIVLSTGKTYLIEIKPACQTVPPTGTKKTKRLLQETATFLVNQAKWDAAEKFAKVRGWEFKVLTEYDIGLK
jgi:hypothetical protein